MKPRAIALALLVACLLAAALAPMAGRYLARQAILRQTSAARQFFIAMQSAAGDQRQAGTGVAYPFESGIHSTAAYLGELEKGGYLSAQDRAAFHDFLIANVSENDPPETVLLISRHAYEALRAGQTPRNFIVFRKGGDGASFKAGANGFFKLPPRQPAFLEP